MNHGILFRRPSATLQPQRTASGFLSRKDILFVGITHHQHLFRTETERLTPFSKMRGSGLRIPTTALSITALKYLPIPKSLSTREIFP